MWRLFDDPLSVAAGGIHLKVKAQKVAWVLCGSVQSSNFSSILKDFLSMVFFMALPFSMKISY
jgi:uncharacterized membrane protein